jgi:membrane protein implicated in regulation of membrane protease activity
MTWYWLWLTGGVILCALEALAPGMFLLWIGLAAIAVGQIQIFAALNFEWSLLLFAGFAVVSVLAGRKFYGSRDVASDRPYLNRRAEALVGQVFVLDQPIVNGLGRVRVRDSIWQATGPDLPAGAPVKVTGVADTTTLKVEGA